MFNCFSKEIYLHVLYYILAEQACTQNFSQQHTNDGNEHEDNESESEL
jgi:hypothetical protein